MTKSTPIVPPKLAVINIAVPALIDLDALCMFRSDIANLDVVAATPRLLISGDRFWPQDILNAA